MRVLRVATGNAERGGLKTDPWGRFITIGRLGEERVKKPEEECSGRMKRTQRGNTV